MGAGPPSPDASQRPERSRSARPEAAPPPSRGPVVEVREVGKVFRAKEGNVVALEDVSFSVGDREFVTIVGPSGCGKSTLLKIVAGLVGPTTGTVRVFDQVVREPVSNVGMVFQTPVLLEWRSVLDNVLLPIEILRRNPNQHREAALQILSLVGLDGFEKRRPSELSGGMQQRAAIARALIHDPTLLLMDEPFGALDQMTREQMNLELLRIWEETHKSTILITHSIEEAVFLADRVVVMTPRPGRVADIVEVGLPRLRQPKLRFSPEFAALVQRVGTLIGMEYG